MSPQVWTNSSVRALAGDLDPVQVITEKARGLALRAIQEGWSGPPYDPFALASYLKVPVVARQDIAEARTIPIGKGALIEFNPNRPRARIKFSICHELAHMLFPDHSERVRNRVTHRDASGDDWQLESLCNIGAAELLLPIGSSPSLEQGRLTIDGILEARKRHEVSAEAVMIRAVRLSGEQCYVFSSSHRSRTKGQDRYVLDYAVGSRAWRAGLSPGTALPESTVAANCIAIGFTAKGQETWESVGPVRVECLGVSPYPNQTHPRVLGLIHPQKKTPVKLAEITYLQGDATLPHGGGFRLITQVINDSAFTWGAGFSLAARNKWPDAQRAFRRWAEADPRNLRLGAVHFHKIEDNLGIASVIAQHGYGPSPKPRIRYAALKTCLEVVAKIAAQHRATVHMPKIGSGQAGGSWSITREFVQEHLCSNGIRVFVYELPWGARPSQPALEF